MCTWNADDGETASDDTAAEYGLCRRLGSGRDTAELYNAIGFEVCTAGTTGATVADGSGCVQVDAGLNTVDIART